MPKYNPAVIEPKWQAYWEQNQTFAAPRMPKVGGGKLYALDMFPYPSGDGLHVGHPEGYTATDIVSRAARMQGKSVLHPMGFDAFGLPAEEHAIKTGEHPRKQTEKNIATFRRQLKSLGFSYDWGRELATTDVEYVRWTQWIFLQIYDTWFDAEKQKGRPIAELPIPEHISAFGESYVAGYQDEHRLAYESFAPVNWCPDLGTVLANEEVIDGKSERGGHPVVRMPLRQWMLRITAYADRLEKDLEPLDWSEGIKALQRNWIGRSTGAEVDFVIPGFGDPDSAEFHRFDQQPTFDEWKGLRVESGFPQKPEGNALRVYTTRPDTLFGATYVVLSPEHSFVRGTLCDDENNFIEASLRERIDKYVLQAASKSELDRTELAKEKTGVFSGQYALNPVNGEPIPIWIADYVLASYGTGAIMAVPGHDERDFEFAQKYGIPIQCVVDPGDAVSADKREQILAGKLVFTEDGVAVNSGKYDGLLTVEFKKKITADLAAEGLGREAVNYKLRDWLFSRQRFWGEPFPILHELDAAGKATGRVRAVDAKDLPVDLPHLDDFKPHGRPEPPLDKAPDDWLYPIIDGKRYKRETNTMPQWAGSCWYYLRFIDPTNTHAMIDPALEKAWMPIDLYVGGAEHAVLHLLYARFWHKVLFDRGIVSTPEPFQKLVNQGMILGENGEKMSKSRGNVINPDSIVKEYGADSLRLYEMYMGPLEDSKPWSMQDVNGVHNFLNRVWRLIIDDRVESLALNASVVEREPTAEENRVLHRTIEAVTSDIEKLKFNTAIARMIEFTNHFTKQTERPRTVLEQFVLLLSPFAPHMAEELWQALGHSDTLAHESWPKFDLALAREDTIKIPIQVNGKVRLMLEIPVDLDVEQLVERARKAIHPTEFWISKKLVEMNVKVVPNRVINFVAKEQQ